MYIIKGSIMETQLSDEEQLLMLLLLRRRRRLRRTVNRSVWVKSWIERRNNRGAFSVLMEGRKS